MGGQYSVLSLVTTSCVKIGYFANTSVKKQRTSELSFAESKCADTGTNDSDILQRSLRSVEAVCFPASHRALSHMETRGSLAATVLTEGTRLLEGSADLDILHQATRTRPRLRLRLRPRLRLRLRCRRSASASGFGVGFSSDFDFGISFSVSFSFGVGFSSDFDFGFGSGQGSRNCVCTSHRPIFTKIPKYCFNTSNGTETILLFQCCFAD